MRASFLRAFVLMALLFGLALVAGEWSLPGGSALVAGASVAVAADVLPTGDVTGSFDRQIPTGGAGRGRATEASPSPTPAPSPTPLPTPSPTPAPVTLLSAPAGSSPARLVKGEFASATLGRTMPYYIILPQGYDDNQAARYPVLYFLHGMSGDPNEWLRYGVQEAATSLMGDGTIVPFIIVLPAGDQGYWVDQVNGGPQYATYVARDVVAEIDGHYRTLPDRQYRAIGGLSMGGHGALQIALNHADVFGVVGAHSPSFRSGADIPSYFGTGADLAQRDPLQLVLAHPEVARTLTLWLDFGPDDFFGQGQNQLEQELVAEGLPHQFHQWPGGHTTEYWTAHVGDYLRFYSTSFADGR